MRVLPVVLSNPNHPTLTNKTNSQNIFQINDIRYSMIVFSSFIETLYFEMIFDMLRKTATKLYRDHS